MHKHLIQLTAKDDGSLVLINPDKIVLVEHCDDLVGSKVAFGENFGRQVKEEPAVIKKMAAHKENCCG